MAADSRSAATNGRTATVRLSASDDRRKKITRVRQQVLEKVQKQQFHGAIKLHHELLELVSEEKLVSHFGDYHQLMTRLYLAVQDLKNAKKYAGLAVADLHVYGGPETAETVQELKGLLESLKNIG